VKPSGWIRRGWRLLLSILRYLAIPLEIEAYALERKFREAPLEAFSVEAEVRGRLQPEVAPSASS
jgi:hypothetical protein